MRNAALVVVAGFALVLGGLALGCKDSGEGGGGGTSAQKVGELPLLADLPEDAVLSKAPVGEGVMVQAANVTMVIAPAKDAAKTLAAAKSDAEMYSPKNIQEETLPDGWVLMFENEGGGGKTWWLQGLRTIEGKGWECSVTSPQAEHQKTGLAICKSLRKQ